MHTRRCTQFEITRQVYLLTLALLANSPALYGDSQVSIPGGVNPSGSLPDRPSAEFPQLPQYLPAESSPGLTLPTVPTAPLVNHSTSGPKFELKGVAFEGNTVFTTEELTTLASPFLGQSVGIADLESLRFRLTKHYTERGYFNSGALIKPGQRLDGGIVTFEIHEGRLADVRVSGAGRLRSSYIVPRVWPDPDQPFNTTVLKEQFGLLLRDPLIQYLNGRLIPGVGPGSALLDLAVTPAKPYRLSLSANNARTPSVGAEQAQLQGVMRNLTGFGDALTLAVGNSEGATDWNGSFMLPISASDTRLELRYANTHSQLIEEPPDNSPRYPEQV